MWASVKVKSAGALPLTAEDMRNRLRIDDPAEDALLEAFLAAAASEIDGPDGIGVAMLAQTWTRTLERWPVVIFLPGWPVTGVSEIRFLDDQGQTQTLAEAEVAALFRLADDESGRRVLVRRPGADLPNVLVGPGAIEIDYTLGHEVGAVEPGLIAALGLLVGHYYEHREAVVSSGAPVEVPLGVSHILNRFRRGVVG